MNLETIVDGLMMYVGLLVLLTFHEFGHAWMAWKCGDDTARLQGRCSLNPLVHMDLIGTVILPLAMIFLPGMGRFLIGWAKPVPVNPHNLRNPRGDDILVSMAGPWMNLALAVALVGLARVGLAFDSVALAKVALDIASLSLLLCFFNLIPVPPLDGSHVLRNLVGMTYETYYQIARFGFLIVIVMLQIPFVRVLLSEATRGTLSILAGWFGIPLR
jgi:Zn-dependent protease